MKEDFIMIGVIAIICLIGIVATIYMVLKKDIANNKFDERQLEAQGKAYKASALSMIIYFVCYMAIASSSEIILFDTVTGIFIGIAIGVVVFASIAISHDAYFSRDEIDKINLFIIGFSALDLAEFYSFIRCVKNGTFLQSGFISGFDGGIPLVSVFYITAILIALAIKKIKERNSDN